MRKLVAAGAMALGIATLPVTAAHASGTWIVGIHPSASTINVGQKVVFKGRVRPGGAAAGQQVVLQERAKPGAKWTTSGKDQLNRRGRYSLVDKPTHHTTHSYRVVMPAEGRHRRGVSKTVKVTVYAWTPLIRLGAVNETGMSFGNVDINGTTYKNSVYSYVKGYTSSVEYNLDHRCDKLRSTFGISDDSSTGGQAEVGLLSDGQSVYDKTFDLGQSESKTLAIDTPLKIKLLATDTSTTTGTFGFGAFGTPLAHCTQ